MYPSGGRKSKSRDETTAISKEIRARVAIRQLSHLHEGGIDASHRFIEGSVRGWGGGEAAITPEMRFFADGTLGGIQSVTKG